MLFTKLSLPLLLLLSTYSAASDVGGESYKACIGCHGEKGSKKALGKKTSFKGQSQQELTMKLLGYKQGILNMYGLGSMKRTMFKKISNKELKEIAKYISTFDN